MGKKQPAHPKNSLCRVKETKLNIVNLLIPTYMAHDAAWKKYTDYEEESGKIVPKGTTQGKRISGTGPK